MFHITRGIHIQHGPAYPSPVLRFPDGTPIPIYTGTEDEHREPKTPPSTEAPVPAADEGAG